MINGHEIWKEIHDYEGRYQVSNLGRVKSLPKKWKTGHGTIKSHEGVILRGGISKNGYKHVTLHFNKLGKTFKVHTLVAIAFLGHKPCGMELIIDHINDDKLDNRVENLQIVTSRFNSHKTQGKYSSQYKGVYWYKATNKWKSQIVINKKKISLGYFKCELKAHIIYNNKVKELCLK